MGCGSSIIVDDTVSKQGCRGDSAVSKFTTNSGVVLDPGEVPTLPRAVPRKLPPLAAHSPGLVQESGERPSSSEILEQLLCQGIIPAQPRERASREAYNMIDDTETPSCRPPPHLESLKGRRDQSVTSKEDMEERMRQAEEGRNKLKEEKLKMSLRTKSAGVRGRDAAAKTGEGDVVSPVEVLQAPETPPSLRGIQQDPPDTDPPQTQGGGDGGSGGVKESVGE